MLPVYGTRIARIFWIMVLFLGMTGCAVIGKHPPQSCWALSHATAGPVRHVVLFVFKPETPESVKADIIRAACELPREIPLIRTLEWGADLNAGARSQGFTHCFAMTFDTFEDVQTYLPHPAHERFKSLAFPYFDKLLVIDFVPHATP